MKKTFDKKGGEKKTLESKRKERWKRKSEITTVCSTFRIFCLFLTVENVQNLKLL